MTTPYENLDLAQLRFLTSKDAANAADATDQANVLRELSGHLQDKVDIMRQVAAVLFGTQAAGYGGTDSAPPTGVWTGKSSTMMSTELHRLFSTADDTPDVLKRNASVLDDIATGVVDTDAAVDRIQQRGNTDTDAIQADLAEARGVVESANDGYADSAGALTEPPFYVGLRESAPPDPAESPQPHNTNQSTYDQTVSPTSDRPMPEPVTDGTGYTDNPAQTPGGQAPRLQSLAPAPPVAPVQHVVAPAPTITGNPVPLPPPTAPVPLPPMGTGPATPSPAQPVAPRTPAPPRPTIGRGPVPTPRPAPPVIGSRPGGGSPFGRPPGAARVSNPDGLNRPVIGTRPGNTSPPAPGRPGPAGGTGGGGAHLGGSSSGSGGSRRNPEHRGNTPAGSTPQVAPPSGGGIRGGPTGTGSRPSRTGSTPAPRRTAKTTGNARGSGTKATRVPKPSGGRDGAENVIGRRHSEKKPKFGRKNVIDERAGQRAPRAVHGDAEAVNRGVIRGAKPAPGGEPPPDGRSTYVRIRKKAAPEQPDRPARADETNPWFDDTATVSPVIRGARRDPTAD